VSGARWLVAAAAIALIGAASAPARAGEWFGGLAYHNAIGIGQTDAFTPGYSFRGVGADVRYRFDPYLSVGLASAWHVLNARSTDVVRIENIDVRGRQRRAFNAVPMLATGHIYTPGALRLMMGIGVGASWIERTVDIGLFRERTDNLHFTVAPELGFVVKPSEHVRLIVSSRYHFAAASGGSPDQQWFSLGLGLGLRGRL
jgi:hypothetical protein